MPNRPITESNVGRLIAEMINEFPVFFHVPEGLNDPTSYWTFGERMVYFAARKRERLPP